MRAERRPPAHVLPELDAEQEVDFRRYWDRVVGAWWLVAAAAAVGVVVGYVVALGGGTLYQSRALVYLGQPLGPGGGQVQSLATNPSTLPQIVRSDSVVAQVAADAGVPAARLKRGISTRAVQGAIARQAQTPLVEISVRGPWRARSAEAANLLAATVVRRVSGYVDAKILTYRDQLEGQTSQLASIERRIEALQASLESSRELPPLDRLTLISQIDNSEQRRGQLLDTATQIRQFLTFAEDVERARLVTRATAVKVEARDRRSAMIVGGVVGLIVGAALALLWEPVLARRVRPR